MKKQILMMTICFSLTIVSATASGTMRANDPSPQANNPGCVSKKMCVDSDQAKSKFEEKMTKDREDLYCKLGLTSEQRAKAEALDKTNRETAKPLMCKLRQEKTKLRELKQKKVCLCEIYKQKQQVQIAKKALREHFKASHKCFEAILTKEQLAKLKVIRSERKADFRKHHWYKHHCNKPGYPCHLNK